MTHPVRVTFCTQTEAPPCWSVIFCSPWQHYWLVILSSLWPPCGFCTMDSSEVAESLEYPCSSLAYPALYLPGVLSKSLKVSHLWTLHSWGAQQKANVSSGTLGSGLNHWLCGALVHSSFLHFSIQSCVKVGHGTAFSTSTCKGYIYFLKNKERKLNIQGVRLDYLFLRNSTLAQWLWLFQLYKKSHFLAPYRWLL